MSLPQISCENFRSFSLFSAIVQSAIFGNMTAVIQKLYASRARFHSKASQIKQFVMAYNIEGELKKRIEDWFISHWSISKGVNTDEVRIE